MTFEAMLEQAARCEAQASKAEDLVGVEGSSEVADAAACRAASELRLRGDLWRIGAAIVERLDALIEVADG